MNLLDKADRLDRTVWSRICPVEALGWLSLSAGVVLTCWSGGALVSLWALKGVIR